MRRPHQPRFDAPLELPPETVCRRLLIPDSPEFMALVNAALAPLLDPANFKSYPDGLTAEETAQAMNAMFESYLANCPGE